ncbi:MAG: hypothetical protein HYS13_06610 [Planctomycetia bacterium]|nr:hypothetical protein [Planctomycetia bacterium]
MPKPRKWELEAFDPTDAFGKARRTCWIDQATIEFITKGLLGARWFRLLCVKDVLLNPIAVFQGWNREGFEDALCYVGRPADHPKQDIELPAPPGRCFLTFVLPSGKIEEWRWESFDPNSEADCRNQFGHNWSQLWPPTETT